jgi:hypothetical protein
MSSPPERSQSARILLAAILLAIARGALTILILLDEIARPLYRPLARWLASLRYRRAGGSGDRPIAARHSLLARDPLRHRRAAEDHRPDADRARAGLAGHRRPRFRLSGQLPDRRAHLPCRAGQASELSLARLDHGTSCAARAGARLGQERGGLWPGHADAGRGPALVALVRTARTGPT